MFLINEFLVVSCGGGVWMWVWVWRGCMDVGVEGCMDVGVEEVYGCGCGGGVWIWVWLWLCRDRMKIVIICAC